MKKRTTLLLNWYSNPYHAPIFVAKALGYYEECGIHLAIIEPSDPSDVTEIVGLGSVDIALKAQVHTLAARAKGFPVVSIATLLDEPPTGLISLKDRNINTFADIKGKRVGYIGEFGKLMVDDLARLAHIPSDSYETVRIGMNVVDAILRDVVDTGIGLSNFQQIELEERSGKEASMLRIDQLAGLGCCCFCSIQFIMNEKILGANVDMVKRFLLSTQRGMSFTTQSPEKAYEILCAEKPQLRTDAYKRIFIHTLPIFSRTLLNVDRDWQKVYRYTKHLGILPSNFNIQDCYSNAHLPDEPYSDVVPIAYCASAS